MAYWSNILATGFGGYANEHTVLHRFQRGYRRWLRIRPLVRPQARKTLVALLLFAFLSSPAYADIYRVVDVHDGDGTYTVEPPQGGERLKVRLHGVDAPELDQPYGQAARDFAVKALLYKEVDVRQTGKHFDRIVAIIEIPGVGIMQELLLQAGLAWIEPRYCGGCKEWKAMEAEARQQKRGLWAGKKPVEPWVWRDMQKKKKGR